MKSLIQLKIGLCIMSLLLSSCATWRSSGPVCMAGAYQDARGQCQAQRAPSHRIPFRAGVAVKVMQGYHGYLSHREDLAYSLDFACEEGTPIVASRGGVVWAVKKDSNIGCADKSCVDYANYVILDHGDGTYSEYYHLQYMGVLVTEGEQVCSGQVIGLCGNTGFSSGPHLHFAISDASRHTVPAQFVESRRKPFRFLVPETTYVSGNDRQIRCGETSYSTLPRDAFAHHGIMLRDDLPIVVDSSDQTMKVRGSYYGDHPYVSFHRKPVYGGNWQETCAAVDAKGRFDFTLNWTEQARYPGFYWIMMTGSDNQCRSPGWAWSYKVRVDE